MTTAGYSQERDDRGMTRREREVLGLLTWKLPNTRIAEELGLTRQRVGHIVKALKEKGFVEEREGGGLVIYVDGKDGRASDT